MARPAAIQNYLAELESLPFVRRAFVTEGSAAAIANDRLDGTLTLQTLTRAYVLPYVQVRSHLGRDQGEQLMALRTQADDLLVLAPSIGRELGAALEAARVNFMDLAGNCFVRLDEAFLARVQGNRPPATAAPDKALRAASYRVLFALFVQPDLAGATTRELARVSGGVSPQTAADVRERLVEQNMIYAKRRSFDWTPEARRRLLELWLVGASTTLYPSLLVGRFRAQERQTAALEERITPRLLGHGRWAWGGGAAAMRLTEYYRGERTVLYFDREPTQTLARELRLLPDAQGPVALMRAPGPLAFVAGLDTVHPLLVYTDLLQEGHERAREAAEEVYNRFLRQEPPA